MCLYRWPWETQSQGEGRGQEATSREQTRARIQRMIVDPSSGNCDCRYPDADDGTERSKRSDTQHRSRHGDRCRARAGVARVVVPFEVCGDVTCPVCGSPVLIYYNILYGVFGIGIYSKRLEGPTAPPPHADTYMYPCVPYLKIPTFRVSV